MQASLRDALGLDPTVLNSSFFKKVSVTYNIVRKEVGKYDFL